jgi:serine/threonine protein kinase/Tfp pilus assembly protein PilF
MSALSPDQWQALSPYLDEALGMTDEERATWLSSLRTQNPDLADQLEMLFDEHRALSEERFLETRFVELPQREGLEGQTLGVYTLLSQIGQGGMGSVWLAKRDDGRFERRVAVKFLSVALIGKDGEKRFKREGRILALLVHPNIAELVDAGVSQSGQPYLVLEHIEGDHIDRYCDQHRMSVASRIRLFLDVLRGVAHAHSNLIVHRDLKPSNVLVRNDGQAKLLDFGIAKLLEREGRAGEASLTVEGGRALTPECAAPEQLRGGAITTATDVYALGVLLYVLLTGQHPAGRGPHTAADLVKAILDTEPVRPSDVVIPTSEEDLKLAIHNAAQRRTTTHRLSRRLRGDLDTIVAKALKKEPTERYSSVTALADDLRRYLKNEPISARPDTIPYRFGKFVRRNRMAVALATLAVVATAAGVAGSLVLAKRARVQRDFALQQLLRSHEHDAFLEFLLSDAAPSGKPFTANELLDRGERIMEMEHSTDPGRHADLMIWIGEDYLTQDQNAKARRLLEQAYALTRSLSDPSIRAASSCGLAHVLSIDVDMPRAEALFQEGLRELTDDPRFALDRVHCLRIGKEVAVQRGDAQEGLARALAARRVLRESPLVTDEEEMQTSLNIADAYSSAGQDVAALSEFEHAAKLLSSLGRDETETGAVLFTGWGVELEQVGRPLEAEKMYRRVIEINRYNNTEEAVFPTLLNNYARILRELNRLDEALDYADRAYTKAQQVHHESTVSQALIERARIYLAKRDFARASAMLAQVEPRLRQSLPPGHYAFASLASEQAMIALERNDVPAATRHINEAVTLVETAIQSGKEGAFYLPALLTRRSVIELAARNPDKAAADSARAVTLQSAAQPGTLSCKVGYAYLSLGHALQAQGKTDEARAAFRSAVENLQSTLGPDHPDARSAGLLAGS